MYMELIKDQSSKKLKGESMSTYQDDSFDLIIGEVDWQATLLLQLKQQINKILLFVLFHFHPIRIKVLVKHFLQEPIQRLESLFETSNHPGEFINPPQERNVIRNKKREQHSLRVIKQPMEPAFFGAVVIILPPKGKPVQWRIQNIS